MENKRCAYCGKERPTSDMHQGTIIGRENRYNPHRGRYEARAIEITSWYCNDAPCHGNDQMAHEG